VVRFVAELAVKKTSETLPGIWLVSVPVGPLTQLVAFVFVIVAQLPSL